MISTSKIFDFLGRIFIAALFVNAVPEKLTDFGGTTNFIATKGIPVPIAGFLLACSIVILILGSLLLVFGKNTRIGASLLLIFLVPTTLIFHSFPIDSGFVRNIAVIGALILAITRSNDTNVRSFRERR